MECSVCLMAYSQQLRPLSLPCGHTFCKVCITKVYRERNVITCPRCQAQHRWTTIEELPINYELEDLMESLNSRGAAGNSLQQSSQTSNQELCSKCRKYMSSWCENCLIFVCNNCTLRQHSTKGHKTTKAKEAIEKLRAQCIQKLDATDVLLNKNISTSKELLASSTAMVQKINRAVTQMEQYRSEVLAQKLGIQSGASLAAVAKSATEVMNQSKKPNPQVFQELKEAQGACNIMESVMKTFKGLSTNEQRGSETVEDGPAVLTPPPPSNVLISPSMFVDSVIIACQDPLPRMLKGRPKGTEVRIAEGQPLPFWTLFKLKGTSPNCWFDIHLRYADNTISLLELKVQAATKKVIMGTYDCVEKTRKRHECNLDSNNFNEEFFVRVKETDDKYILKFDDNFVGYCKKPKRTGKKSLCTKISIEGKNTQLLEFRVLRNKE